MGKVDILAYLSDSFSNPLAKLEFKFIFIIYTYPTFYPKWFIHSADLKIGSGKK